MDELNRAEVTWSSLRDLDAPRLASPDYDLSLLARELEQLPCSEATMGEERPRQQQPIAQHNHAKWFWGVLVVAVLGMLALIARLVQKA